MRPKTKTASLSRPETSSCIQRSGDVRDFSLSHPLARSALKADRGDDSGVPHQRCCAAMKKICLVCIRGVRTFLYIDVLVACRPAVEKVADKPRFVRCSM